MSEEQEETPVITLEKPKDDEAQEGSPDVVEDTDAADESKKETENVDPEPVAEETVDDTPSEDVAATEEESEPVLDEASIEEEMPTEEEESPSPANKESAVQEEKTLLKDVPTEEEAVEVEDAPVEDVAIEEAAVKDVLQGASMEDVLIEQEVEDEASEPVPEAPVDIIGDECAQEPVEEETTIPTVESKDLEEALEETEQDAKLNAEAEELAQAVDRNINIDPAVVASAATSIAKEEAPETQDINLIRPIVIAGPSGAGKGTLIEGLMKRFPNDQFGFSVSHTTRKPREGEVNGVHYNFTSVESIKAEIDAGKFIEYAEVHGNYYGTSVDAVKSVQEQGKVCILDIDVQGVRNVKKSSLKPYYIFIAPPSMEDLEARLRGRGTEKEEDIQKRLANAAGEIQFGKEPGNFDKYLVNGNLAFAANDLAGYVKEWYPHLKEVAVDQKESNFVQDCVTTATETCIIS